MNIFQLEFESKLREWAELRQNLVPKPLDQKCIEIDNFWQQCPMVNHYLHPIDMESWPDPWELLNEGNYCKYARALGMIYTLILLGVRDIDFVDAKDENDEDVVLVLVDDAKYILNYWPDTVVNNCLTDFKIIKRYNISAIIKKIGQA